MNNVIIITGSAPCLQEDLAIWGHLAARCPHIADGFPACFDWMAVGLDGVDKYTWPICYCVTYHPDEISQIRERRAAYGGNGDYKMISHLRQDGVDIIEPYEPPTGSSALCGALAAIRMGYSKIILCGCPLEGVTLAGTKCETFRAGWEAKKDRVQGIVKSMSGWTREFLDAPTKEWLEA
jgi:hypothetical protein